MEMRQKCAGTTIRSNRLSRYAVTLSGCTPAEALTRKEKVQAQRGVHASTASVFVASPYSHLLTPLGKLVLVTMHEPNLQASRCEFLSALTFMTVCQHCTGPRLLVLSEAINPTDS